MRPPFLVVLGEHDGHDELIALLAPMVVDLPEDLLPLVLEGPEVVFVPGVIPLGEGVELLYHLQDNRDLVRERGRNPPGEAEEIRLRDEGDTLPERVISPGRLRKSGMLHSSVVCHRVSP